MSTDDRSELEEQNSNLITAAVWTQYELDRWAANYPDDHTNEAAKKVSAKLSPFVMYNYPDDVEKSIEQLKSENEKMNEALQLGWLELSRWPAKYPEDETVWVTNKAIGLMEQIIDGDLRSGNEE